MDAFLSRTFHVNGGYDNNKGMSKLNSLMEQIEVVIRGHSLIEKKFFLFIGFPYVQFFNVQPRSLDFD